MRSHLLKNMISISVLECCEGGDEVFLYIIPRFGASPLLQVGFQILPVLRQQKSTKEMRSEGQMLGPNLMIVTTGERSFA